MRTYITVAATAILIASVLTIAGGAMAQTIPSPSPIEDLGWGENDVSDEPDQTALGEDNGFDNCGTLPNSSATSCEDPTLVLDAYTEERGFVAPGQDYNAIRHNAMPGTSHSSGESYLYPGSTMFEAWWGVWEDTGAYGDFQSNNDTSSALAEDGESPAPNGAIDDAAPCNDKSWDEFTFRVVQDKVGDEDGQAPECGQIQDTDSMFAFVQPGTHAMHMNSVIFGSGNAVSATFNDRADHWKEPDFVMENELDEDDGSAIWRAENGFGRITYDQSLAITTNVTTAVNPEQVPCTDDLCDEEADSYNPFKAGSTPHAVDVDIYTSVNGDVETLYRTAVWDPPSHDHTEDDPDNNEDILHENGPKGFLKYPVHNDVWKPTMNTTRNTVNGALESSEPFQGAAGDPVFGVYKHEPNTPEDDFQGATLNASYDGFDGYYTETYRSQSDVPPGVNESFVEVDPDASVSTDYSPYQNDELFWADVQVSVNTFPLWIAGCCYGYNGFSKIAPELPEGDDPISTFDEGEDDDTQAPGVMYLNGQFGAWHDKTQDNWIGAPDEDHPQDVNYYDGGTDADPHQYMDDSTDKTSWHRDEWRGACSANFVESKLVPTHDTNGDDEADWGSSGVYVMGDFGNANPYSDAVSDLGGEEYNTATHPLRNFSNEDVNSTAKYWFPEDDDAGEDEDERFSRYYTKGTISTLGAWSESGSSCEEEGDWFNSLAIVFPTGTMDFGFKSEHTVELREDWDSQVTGQSLKNQTVTDVDYRYPIEDSGSGFN